MEQVESQGGGLSQVLSRSSTVGSEDGMQQQDQQPPPRRRPWLSAKTILGTLTVLFSLAMLGISIKLVAKYGDTGLVHVSFICVGFTVSVLISTRGGVWV